jgi:hypothetical protein
LKVTLIKAGIKKLGLNIRIKMTSNLTWKPPHAECQLTLKKVINNRTASP